MYEDNKFTLDDLKKVEEELKKPRPQYKDNYSDEEILKMYNDRQEKIKLQRRKIREENKNTMRKFLRGKR